MGISTGWGNILGEGLRNLARNLFPGFYERGISANQALQELRSQGLGYRRSDFLADFRQDQEGYDQATAIRYISPQNYPSERILEPKYFGVPDKYSMVFKVEGVDEEGNPDTGYFFYHRNTLDTRANMENEAYDYIKTSEGDSAFPNAKSISLVEGYINPVWQ